MCHEPEVYHSLIWSIALVLIVGIVIGGAYLKANHANRIMLQGGYQEQKIAESCTAITGWRK